MSFLYPGFLFALAALAVPIIIHLFNFRRYKKLYFSNVSFLQNVKEETRSRSRLKHLLVLLMRLLALTFLVFAFAQPYVPSEEKELIKGDRAISIYIDNSFSMEGEEAEGRLIDLAKEQAVRIVEEHDATDRFQLHTNTPSSGQHRWYSQSGIIERIDEVEVSPHTEKASSVIAEQKEALRKRKESGRIFFISDLQRSVTDPKNFEKNGEPSVFFLPLLPEQKRNLYVDSVWFKTPVRMIDQEEELGIRLVNTGSKKAEEIPVKLDVDGERTALGSFDIPPDGSKDTSLFFTHSDTGIHHATISISDHPVTFDDRFYFSYRIEGSIPVLRVAPSEVPLGQEDPLASVFEEDPLFDYRSEKVDRIDHSRLKEAHLILLDRIPEVSSGLTEELQKFMESGGHVVLIPSLGGTPEAYNSYLTSLGMEAIEKVDSMDVQISSINTAHHFYRNVFQEVPDDLDLSELNFYYRLKQRVRSKRKDLMTLRNGEPFLFYYPYEGGRSYFFAAPPDAEASGLMDHAIYPTTLLRMAELSQPSQDPYRILGSKKSIQLRAGGSEKERPFRLEAVNGDLDLIPDQDRYGGITRIRTRGRVNKAGHYRIVRDEHVFRGIGINYSREESQLSHYNQEGFQSELTALGDGYKVLGQKVRRGQARMGSFQERSGLWWYCIIFVLVFFGLETMILAFPRTLGLE